MKRITRVQMNNIFDRPRVYVCVCVRVCLSVCLLFVVQ